MTGRDGRGRGSPPFQDGDLARSRPFQRILPSDPILTRLRERYDLDRVVGGATSDMDRLRALGRWVHGRWVHHSSNRPPKPDPLVILEAAARGDRFRCVEYALVMSAAANALGLTARVVGLKMRDAATRDRAAGHSVAEIYLPDLRRWVMFDGQWNALPILDDKPINAVELRACLALHHPGLRLDAASTPAAGEYFRWIAPYLHYFDTDIDNRLGRDRDPGRLMLVPAGAPALVRCNGRPLRFMVYTHSYRHFYAAPG